MRVEGSSVPVLKVGEQATAAEVPGKSLRRHGLIEQQIPMQGKVWLESRCGLFISPLPLHLGPASIKIKWCLLWTVGMVTSLPEPWTGTCFWLLGTLNLIGSPQFWIKARDTANSRNTYVCLKLGLKLVRLAIPSVSLHPPIPAFLVGRISFWLKVETFLNGYQFSEEKSKFIFWNMWKYYSFPASPLVYIT